MAELHARIAEAKEVLAQAQRSLSLKCLSLRDMEEFILASEATDNPPNEAIDSDPDRELAGYDVGFDDDGFQFQGKKKQRL
eukprot:2430284-Rhodomonas_salina.3